ncbi:RNA polymerase factor sigma-54 [Marinisporobacter balticus]|uniref:RNA polymerase RpoN-/SigL-like sigma 54 subunit n=1 Tax=Marinisporobacter balticus TaxID=2018667 RepID=A0A4R2KXW6_9FIRM|nr:RNA polymerase factor sigma-54 [Marinisporobacter balticus]TCO79461.1 RNA polymerase RpoN-/SigL-like sigma 54 subunit [Marinisporobacter balticus]
MRLGFSLNIEQVQKLVMTPELKQAIQILQFNHQELNQFIDEQVLINPVVELGNSSEDEKKKKQDEKIQQDEKPTKDEVDWKEYFKEYDDISYKQPNYNKDQEKVSFEQFVSADVTLTEHLLFQLQFAILETKYKKIGKYIIESLDVKGYLNVNISEIASYFDISEEEVESVLSVIQTFDPIGIAARNLKECLLIQLKQKGIENVEIVQIISNHLEDVAQNRILNIAKSLNISTQRVQEITDFIKRLEPKPGRAFSSGEEIKYITPDVTVEKIEGEYIVLVNDTTAPRLSVSPYYRKMLLHENKDSSTSKFLTGKLNSAMWLIKSIEQRRQTIYNVVKEIVDYQIEFFEHGKKHLKPLTLKQIADQVGVHESTVSRAVNGKYMQSPRGVFEIKTFFTSGVSNEMGEGIASGSIKSMIKDLIDKEDPKKPLSDQAVSENLKEKGINISRRTVAKYRDEMKITSSSKRKRF